MELRTYGKPPKEPNIPKHRFDCVNLCLKETKETLKARTAEVDQLTKRVATLDKELLESKVETALAESRAKNLTAVKALIDFEKLSLQDRVVIGLSEQISKIKSEQDYLFVQPETTGYMLVPVNSIADNASNRRKSKWVC